MYDKYEKYEFSCKEIEMAENKKMFGICKVGERGQIVIPKDAREMFNIKPGDSLILLGDKKKGGMALVKVDVFESFAEIALGDKNAD